jgi:hypothetical protein
MPPRWLTFLLLAWLAAGVAITLLLHFHHHATRSP